MQITKYFSQHWQTKTNPTRLFIQIQYRKINNLTQKEFKMSHFRPINKKKKRSVYLGEFKLSPDIWIILGALAQLEREMIIERVRAGVANAKAKGVRIGRVKKRNSLLIRSLAEAKLSYREIARIAKCSHGSVHAELVAMRKENELRDKQEREKMISEISQTANQSSAVINGLNSSPEKLEKVRENFEASAKASVQKIQGQYYETVG